MDAAEVTVEGTKHNRVTQETWAPTYESNAKKKTANTTAATEEQREVIQRPESRVKTIGKQSKWWLLRETPQGLREKVLILSFFFPPKNYAEFNSRR